MNIGRIALVVLPCACALVCLTACPPLDGGPNGEPNNDGLSDPNIDSKPVGLKRFESDAELLAFFRRQARERASGAGGPLGGDLRDQLTATPLPDAGEIAAVGAADGSTLFSTTNLQEADVDESDHFKSDGLYFYIAKETSLRIVRASPRAQMAEVGRLDLDDYVDTLYLADKRVILLGWTAHDTWPAVEVWPPYVPRATAVAYEVDVSDAAKPTVLRRVEFDGALVSSRLTNGRLILVLTVSPDLPEPQTILHPPFSLDEVLPKRRTAADTAALVPTDSWYRPEFEVGYATTAVVTLDAANIEQTLGAVAVVADAYTVYASREAVYIAGYRDFTGAPLSTTQTAIHKFAFNAAGVAEYVGSGSVPGYLLNQFSLGEHDSHLRVATHLDPAVAIDRLQDTGRLGTNAVYVLADTGGKLEIVGRVEGIAPDETIYAARFAEKRGYLVTYRRVDPLFVLDLTLPTEPKLMGALKVPGFSDYLHPLGETHLIGVGKYTVSTRGVFDRFEGVQVSLFDVTDWSNPQVVQQLTLGGRGSECDASLTHKAFTFVPETNLLALPMRLTAVDERPSRQGTTVFDGVVAFRVDTGSGFTELGRVDSVLKAPQIDASWRRAAVIGEDLYALTAGGVRAANVNDFGSTVSVSLD